MKRLSALFLVGVMAISMAACGQIEENKEVQVHETV